MVSPSRRHLSSFKLPWVWLMLKHRLCHQQPHSFLTLLNTDSPVKTKEGKRRHTVLKHPPQHLPCALTDINRQHNTQTGLLLKNPSFPTPRLLVQPLPGWLLKNIAARCDNILFLNNTKLFYAKFLPETCSPTNVNISFLMMKNGSRL